MGLSQFAPISGLSLLFGIILGQAPESEHFLFVSDEDLLKLKESKGKYAPLLSDMCKFYRDWHVKSDGVYGNLTYYSDTASLQVMLLKSISSVNY